MSDNGKLNRNAKRKAVLRWMYEKGHIKNKSVPNQIIFEKGYLLGMCSSKKKCYDQIYSKLRESGDVGKVKTDKVENKALTDRVFYYLQNEGYMKGLTVSTWRKERHHVLKYIFPGYIPSRETIEALGIHIEKNHTHRGFMKTREKYSAFMYYSKSRKQKKFITTKHNYTGFYSSDEWRALRVKALTQYGRKCCLCGRSAIDGVVLHVDHIKPRSKYPELELDIDNLQILCEDCNLGKSNKYEEKWR